MSEVKRGSYRILVSNEIGPAFVARSRKVISAALAGAASVLTTLGAVLELKNAKYPPRRSTPPITTPAMILVCVDIVI
jgi:hypothetical protein